MIKRSLLLSISLFIVSILFAQTVNNSVKNGNKLFNEINQHLIKKVTSSHLDSIVVNNPRSENNAPLFKVSCLFNEEELNTQLNIFFFTGWAQEGWKARSESHFVYDDDNRVILDSTFSYEDEQWMVTYKKSFKYNESGQIVETIESYLDEDEMKILPYEKVIYFYDNQGMDTLSETFGWSNSDWLKRDVVKKHYNGQNDIIAEYAYNVNGGKLTLDMVDSTFYQKQGMPAELKQYRVFWGDNDTINTANDYFKYDNDGNTIERFRENWNDQTSEYDSSTVDKFDFDKGLFEETMYPFSRIQIIPDYVYHNRLVKQTIYKKSDQRLSPAEEWNFYYNKDVNTGNQFTNKLESSVFPSPATDFITVSSIDNGTYQITSLSGQVASQGVIASINTIDVSGLESGIYLIQIQTESSTNLARFIKE